MLLTLINLAKDKNYDEKLEDDEENDIMSHLNYRKLQKIKQDFLDCQVPISQDVFIMIMLNNLPQTKDMTGLIKNLIELF